MIQAPFRHSRTGGQMAHFRKSAFSCMGSGWLWQWQENEKQETVYHEDFMYTAVRTAIALKSIHPFRVSFSRIAFFRATRQISTS